MTDFTSPLAPAFLLVLVVLALCWLFPRAIVAAIVVFSALLSELARYARQLDGFQNPH